MVGASAKRQRRCAGGIAVFPDDLLLEVFSRVGNFKGLFSFAATCRRWLRRFTDPAFLRQLCPGHGEGHRARLLGFFFQQMRFALPRRGRMNDRMQAMRMRVAQRTSVSAPSFLPAPGSPLGVGGSGTPTSTYHHRALTSLAAADDGTFNYAEPLAARRGIVPRTLDGLERMTPTARAATSHPLLGLCNPITGERHVLPPLESPDLGRCDSYAIVSAADSDLDGKPPPIAGRRRFEFSQLLLITSPPRSRAAATIRSYSAATRSWSTPTVCLDGSRFSMAGERSAVVHRCAVHWLCVDRPYPPLVGDECLLYKLSAGVGAAAATSPPRASLAKIPPIRGGGSPRLFVSADGNLSVACVYLLHVTVWTQQQPGGDESGGGGGTPATWLRTSVMRIPMAGSSPGPLCEPCGWCTWLDFSGGSMLVLPASGGVFVLDLERKVVEKAMDVLLPQKFSSERNRFIPESGTCVPYDMDLVEFFVRQLGGLCR